jgi:hypothetical protein
MSMQLIHFPLSKSGGHGSGNIGALVLIVWEKNKEALRTAAVEGLDDLAALRC